MKQAFAIIITYLALASCALAAPVYIGAAEASLEGSVRSFESAYTQLDGKMQAVTQAHEVFGKREKWITGIAAGLTAIGTSGYIASSAIPMAMRRQKGARVAQLRAAVATANAAAKVGNANAGLGQAGRALERRAAADLLKKAAGLVGKHTKEDAESFHTALSQAPSRTPSMRIGDLADHDAAQHTPVHPSALMRSKSFPAHRSNGQTPSPGDQHSLAHDALDTHERIAALEAALLDLRKHQHERLTDNLSLWTKAMIGAGLINAAGGIVSAELSVQNTIEGSRVSSADALPDVTNLDAKTCARFANTIDGLDCSKAHGAEKRTAT